VLGFMVITEPSGLTTAPPNTARVLTDASRPHHTTAFCDNH
jgi:hypothetical protein